jgi:hypothetical protein
MQTIEIWIEHDHPQLKAMQYHPSRGWLVANGHDPRLTRKVHITQARELQQQMTTVDDVGTWAVLNRQFHGLLMDAARSPRHERRG